MRHGFLLIDKPLTFTSHDCVAVVRRELGERKVGHLGTLDPAASGLLVLAVGAKALKVVELFSECSKEYEAEITLGVVSSTYDSEGILEVLDPKSGVGVPTIEQVQKVIQDHCIGKIEQVPPAASAVKVGGERAYRKMRSRRSFALEDKQGRPFEMPSRVVEIEKCEIMSYEAPQESCHPERSRRTDMTYPLLKIKVSCSSGTYIRSLAHDIGHLLRTGAYLSGLRRTKIGEWSVEGAKDPREVQWTDVMPLKDVLAGNTRIELSVEDMEKIRHGIDIPGTVEPNTIAWSEGLPCAVLEQKGECMHGRKVL